MDYYDLDKFPSLVQPLDRPVREPAMSPRRYRIYTYIITFLLMFLTWVVLSGKFDAFHLSLGVISCAIVTYMSRDLLFVSGRLQGLATLSVRFIAYIPWLLWQIWLANLHVLKLALSPKAAERLEPHMIRLPTRLKSELSIVTLANSITLTPGTITVYASTDGKMTIHALDRKVGDIESLRAMEARVAKAFGENI
jgi:multicomponent Na+:H+ antiporter subunit E